MQKRFVFISILTCLTLGVSAQTVHSFLFCKTNDQRIGQSVRMNFANVRELFQNVATSLNYPYVEHVATGTHFTADQVLSLIDETDIKTNDIVLVLFSTHGTRSEFDSNIFPQLDIPDKLISAYQQHLKLKGKNPRFILTLVEACNGIQNVTPQESFVYEQGSGEQLELTLAQQSNIQKLFTNDTNCSIIATAGQPGKNTWATPYGSMFINCFLRAFNEVIESGYSVTWDNILQRAKNYTYSMTSNTAIQYYPVWEKSECETKTVSRDVDTKSIIADVGLTFTCDTWTYDRETNMQWYKIHLFTESSRKIEKVIYYLHHTMSPAIVTRTSAEEKYRVTLTVWGYYLVKAKVYFTDGKVVDVYKEFNFDKCR